MKRTGVVVLLVLATLLWTVGIVAVWAQRQMLDTQNWVQTSDRLLENEEIRDALSTAILQRVYASAPVENQLRETLPDNLKPLAGPISAALREVANRNAPKVLGSAAALDRVGEGQPLRARDARSRILDGDVARGGDRRPSTSTTSSRRSPPAPVCPPGVADKLPANLQQLEVLKTDKIEAAQKAMQTAKTLTIVLVVLAVLLMAGAVALVDRSPPHGGRRAAGASSSPACSVLALRRVGGDAAVNALAESPERAPRGQGRVRHRDVAAHRRRVGLDRLRPLPGHRRLAGRPRAARDGAAPGQRPGAARAPDGLPRRPGLPLLLLVIWGPVPWTRSFWPVLVFTIAAFIWLERVRHVTLEEFGDVAGGRARAQRARALGPAPGERRSAGRRIAAALCTTKLTAPERQRQPVGEQPIGEGGEHGGARRHARRA